MKFNNVIDWFNYIKGASLEELTKLIDDRFYLYHYLNNDETCIVDESTISIIQEKLHGTDIEERFWGECLSYIHIGSLTNEFLNFLINHRIAIQTLGHLLLPDKFLWRSVDDVDEAILTLGNGIIQI
ncbi:MAG TPA: hypothetical protein VHY08_12450 [Bacillota bacterium]|nr:hypothetical protein [Bacillota bacterium]